MTTRHHTNYIQMRWLSRNRGVNLQNETKKIILGEIHCFVTLLFFFFFFLLLELRCMEAQFQRECQEQETWALDYTIPTPNWLSGPLVLSPSCRRHCKTLGEGTVGNLASQETTCYATSISSYITLQFQNERLAPLYSPVFPRSHRPQPSQSPLASNVRTRRQDD